MYVASFYTTSANIVKYDPFNTILADFVEIEKFADFAAHMNE